MIYELTCFFLRIALKVFFSHRMVGTENIPAEGSFILCSNHVSHADPPALCVFVKRDLYYIAKEELVNVRFFGWYFSRLHLIPIDRTGRSIKGIKEVARKIKGGYPIVIFPEGTRSEGKGLLRPQAGAAYFALKFGIPVVPAYIKGTDQVLPKGAKRMKRAPITVFYGKPKFYSMDEDRGKEEVLRETSIDIMNEIAGLKRLHAAN